MSRDESPFVRAVTEDGGYTWVHRAFLQAFQTHGVLTVDEMKPILAAVMSAQNSHRPWTGADITQPQITNTVQTINAKIQPFDFEIRNILDQQTKSNTYALVNKTSDALTQLATRFSASEIAYIRRLLDYMFETNNTHNHEIMAIKHTQASQLARVSRQSRQSQANGTADDGGTSQPADTGISIQEADEVLDTLVHESFFQKSRAGYYSLAARSLMELGAYLKETYNETAGNNEDGQDTTRIRNCSGCSQIVTFGIRCNDRDCGVRWHDACANNFYKGRSREARKCPKCSTQCSGDVYVGERADRVVRRSSTGGNRQSRQVREDEEDDE